jgi:hypothetical protein
MTLHSTAQLTKKEKKIKNKEKDPPIPQSRQSLYYEWITPHSGGDCLILTYVNRYKAFIFKGIII